MIILLIFSIEPFWDVLAPVKGSLESCAFGHFATPASNAETQASPTSV